MIRNVLTGAVLSAVLFLSACNTVEGVGRDLQSAGTAVEDTAK